MPKLKFIFIFTLLVFGFSAAHGQEEPKPESPKQDFNQPRNPNSLLRELGLTQDQIRQIRIIHADTKDKMRDAQFRLREANRNLDGAIYADNADEGLIQQRLRQFQEAQAEVVKIRVLTELAVRKVLTPEQLARFRQLRQRFMQGRQNRQENIQNRQENPPNRQPQPNDRPPPSRQPPPRPDQ